MNKKGAEWIAWVLATALFVSISVMGIIWARTQTTEMTESTAQYLEGREECKMIIVSAEKIGGCNSINVKNRGTLTIKRFIVRIDETESTETEALLPGAETAIDLSSGSPSKSVELLPIIEISKGNLASCTTKRLVIECV